MADLSRNNRGQILLIAAFALAVIFVAMALIVNSAIFTENLASRGETSGSEGALSMRADVVDNVGGAIEAANRNDGGSVNAVRASIRNISRQTGEQSARSGRVVDVAYQSGSEEDGERIYQAADSNFTNAVGGADYQLVGNVSRVEDGNGTRAFVIEASNITATSSTPFEISVQNTSAGGNENRWRTQIWNVSSDTVHVRTEKSNDTGATVTEDCEVTTDGPGPNVTIDVTGGTIDGEECDALGTGPSGENFHFGAGTGVEPDTSDTYDISFDNADEITGRFSLVVYDGGDLDVAAGPQSNSALYEVTVAYTYLTTDLRYETDVRVAPGEPDV